MSFFIKRRDQEGFKIWLSLLGYVRKDLPDGGCTFKGKGTKHEYVLITKDLSGNHTCKILYAEYRVHLLTPDMSATDIGIQNINNAIMGKR
jgi:hypothetical protein